MESKHKPVIRIIVAALVIIVCAIGAKYVLGDMLSYQKLSETLHEAGPWGVALFLGAAMIGTLLHFPAYLFLAVCFLFYSGISGLFMGFATATAIFTCHYFFGRIIGKKPLQHIKNPFLLKTLSQLDTRPLQSVILLRVVFFMSPIISFALGLSSIKYRNYLLGSLLGISLQFTGLFLFVHFSRDIVTGWIR